MNRLPAPWPLAALALGQAACLALVALAAHVAAGEAAVDDQRAWLVAAIAAAAASGAANGVWLVGLRRGVARRRARVLARLDAAAAAPPSAPAPSEPAGPPVSLRGMTLVHRPTCALVAGKPVVPAGAGTPCGWCRP